MPLLLRLFLLIAVALLPVIAIQAYNEIDQRRARQVEVRHHALGLAELAAAEQQQFVQGIRQMLIAMSDLPAIKAKDGQACEAYLSTIKKRYPELITLMVADMKADAFCFPDSPVKADSRGRAYFDNAVR